VIAAFPKINGRLLVEGSCCSSQGLRRPDKEGEDLCDVDRSIWETSKWNAVEFQMDSPHAFLYSFNSKETGDGATFVVTANGDLDCDGVESTLQRMGFVPAAGLAKGTTVPLGGCAARYDSLPPYYFVKRLKASLRATCGGLGASRHQLRRVVRGGTYHLLQLEH
jgi:hypothetical protein